MVLRYHNRASYELVYTALNHQCGYQCSPSVNTLYEQVFNIVFRSESHSITTLYIEACAGIVDQLNNVDTSRMTGGYSNRIAFNADCILIEYANDMYITNRNALELTMTNIPSKISVHGFLIYDGLENYEPLLYITSQEELYFYPESKNKSILIPPYKLRIG